MSLSGEQQAAVDRAVILLRDVGGVRAIALGGSHATGRARPDSDIDLAIYYAEVHSLDIAGVRRVANELSAVGPVDVTDLYGWGQWVNGGGWLTTSAGRMDFIYRNIDQVERTIADALRGVVHHDYAQQPPTGFYSVTYLAETHVCVPLHDPDCSIANLKHRVATYPPAMKETIVRDNLGSAEFTLLCLSKYVSRGDSYSSIACFTRVLANLTQVVYALNDRYFINDKAIGKDVEAFQICPRHFLARANDLLRSADLMRSLESLKQLWNECVNLAGTYKPRFT
jgi:predicted nucleotidyltransferase